MNQNNNNNNNRNVHQSGGEFRLFVGDLPLDCNDETLQQIFQSRFKSVKKVQIIRNENGSSRGFGFIRFDDQTDFQAALSQEVKIGDTPLRLDMAHKPKSTRGGRYSSFNNSVSNNHHHNNHHFNNSNSNLHHHHPHHHNQPHHQNQQQQQHHNLHHHSHHRHHQQQHNSQSDSGSSTKALMDHTHGSQQHHHQQGPNHPSTIRSNTSSNSNSSQTTTGTNNPPPQHQHQQTQQQKQQSSFQHQHQQQHTNPHLDHNIFNSNTQRNNSTQQSGLNPRSGPKHPNITPSGDDNNKSAEASQSQNAQTHAGSQTTSLVATQASQLASQNLPSQHALPQVTSAASGGAQVVGSDVTTPSSAVPNNTAVGPTSTTTIPLTSVNHSSASAVAAAMAMHNSHQNLNTTHQQTLGPDMRSYAHPPMLDSNMIGAADQPSVLPQTSFYSHMYPYGPPPPFGYMPPQPNPVMPISAVPPAPPNSSASSGGVGLQQHSITSPPNVNPSRFSNNHQQQHHHSQTQHHPHHHQPQQGPVPHAGVDTSALGATMPHQAPFYYYYPSPVYFDQASGATGGPPNHLYHPQTFHPQFFAVPGPAYLPNPNAHTFSQPSHQSQPPTASQSETVGLLSQPSLAQPPPPPQSQQQPASHQQSQQQQTKDS